MKKEYEGGDNGPVYASLVPPGHEHDKPSEMKEPNQSFEDVLDAELLNYHGSWIEAKAAAYRGVLAAHESDKAQAIRAARIDLLEKLIKHYNLMPPILIPTQEARDMQLSIIEDLETRLTKEGENK